MAESANQSVVPTTDIVGRRIRDIRQRYGLTGAALAKRLGCSQARISKIETGKLKPSIHFVQEFAKSLKLPTNDSRELEFLTELFLLEFDRWHLAMAGAAPAIQKKIASIEQGADYIRSVDWFILSGLLQTENYASYLFKMFSEIAAHDAADAVQERLRRQNVLKSKRKRFSFIVSEHVFYANFCPREVVLEQIEFLAGSSQNENLTLQIFPAFRPMPVMPVTSFDIYDDRLVLIETRDFQVRVWEKDEVGDYVQDFELLRRFSTQMGLETDEVLDQITERVLKFWR